MYDESQAELYGSGIGDSCSMGYLDALHICAANPHAMQDFRLDMLLSLPCCSTAQIS